MLRFVLKLAGTSFCRFESKSANSSSKIYGIDALPFSRKGNTFSVNMGLCYSCCRNASTDITPDIETRRRQHMEAAERRMKEQEGRGIKDPARLKRQQLRQQELERKEEEVAKFGDSGSGLRWQMNSLDEK